MDLNACTCETYFLRVHGSFGQMDDDNVKNGTIKKIKICFVIVTSSLD
jgi:hypothetical protein